MSKEARATSVCRVWGKSFAFAEFDIIAGLIVCHPCWRAVMDVVREKIETKEPETQLSFDV